MSIWIPRIALTAILILIIVPATAQDLGSGGPTTKTQAHIFTNPGTPDGREGGETMADAILIPDLPFSDTGNTSDNVDDYDVACPFPDSTSPDVVYSYYVESDLALTVDLCGSGYDTKTYILDEAGEVLFCNDDAYFEEPCGQYVSKIEDAPILGLQTIFIVIDGYGGDAGNYILEVTTGPIPEPCVLVCNGEPENEPPLHDGYVDLFNSGCGSESGPLFPHVFGHGCWPPGTYTWCATSGWYGDSYRDTDWIILTLGETGVVQWILEAEQETYGFHLAPTECALVAVETSMLVEPCEPQLMVLTGEPFTQVWIWVGPSTFEPPTGFEGHEYAYMCTFDGLMSGGLSTTEATLEGIKALYR